MKAGTNLTPFGHFLRDKSRDLYFGLKGYLHTFNGGWGWRKICGQNCCVTFDRLYGFHAFFVANEFAPVYNIYQYPKGKWHFKKTIKQWIESA